MMKTQAHGKRKAQTLGEGALGRAAAAIWSAAPRTRRRRQLPGSAARIRAGRLPYEPAACSLRPAAANRRAASSGG